MHPVLFTIPGIHLPIHSYGVMLGISVVAGWFLTIHFGKDDFQIRHLKRLIIVSAVAALVGARLLAVLTTWRCIDWSNPLLLLIPGHTGLVAYGGFMGGFAGAFAYARRKRLSVVAFADAATPSLALGLGISRIGCFLYGCDYGRPIHSDAPGWLQAIGVRFPNWADKFHNQPGFSTHPALRKGAPAFWHHVHDGLIQSDAAISALVYPAQLLSSLNGFIALGLVLWLRKKSTFKGQLFLCFVMYYGLTRTLIEFIRGDSGRGVLLSLTTSQWIGLASFALALVTYLKLKKRHG
ncbi:MAG: prolipoprotein diacylglyceryl transferase [Deltaproteobacteria bacterium]|nr:prolipoprotein diacylglyceryl transferase [Deltaproteobacteria bacterium]